MFPIIYILIFWNIGLTLLVVVFWFFLKGFFPQRKRGLLRVIEDNLQKGDELKKELSSIKKELLSLGALQRVFFKKVGVVRFNPFDRVGGEQSYSLSILTNENTGLVITFLYTREGVRVYVKEVKNGHGVDGELSAEEQKAIVKAV